MGNVVLPSHIKKSVFARLQQSEHVADSADVFWLPVIDDPIIIFQQKGKPHAALAGVCIFRPFRLT
jgi:hypothetical protein